MELIIAAGMSVVLAICWYFFVFQLFGGIVTSPQRQGDEMLYFMMVSGQKAQSPFHYRWLLPWLERKWSGIWQPLNITCLIATAPVMVLYAAVGGLSWFACLYAAALYLGLFGVSTYLFVRTFFVDSAATLFALSAATLWLYGWWAPAIVCVLIATCFRETSFVYAALFAWTPWLLIGGVAFLARHLISPPCKGAPNPFTYVRDYGKRHFRLRPTVLLLPWCAALAALFAPSAQLIVALLIGYFLCTLASEHDRIYMAPAFPIMCASAAMITPILLMLPLIALHFSCSALPWHWNVSPDEVRRALLR